MPLKYLKTISEHGVFHVIKLNSYPTCLFEPQYYAHLKTAWVVSQYLWDVQKCMEINIKIKYFEYNNYSCFRMMFSLLFSVSSKYVVTQYQAVNLFHKNRSLYSSLSSQFIKLK